MKRKIISIFFALVLACSLSLVTAVPAAVSANGTTFAGSTIGVESVHLCDLGAEIVDAFNNEPETLVVDGVAFDAQTSPAIIKGEVSALTLGAGWVDTAYVEIGLRPEATMNTRNAGVFLIALNAPAETQVHLQDYTGGGRSGGVIKIAKNSSFSYKITLEPSGDIGGTATLEVWVGGVSEGTATLAYGYASTWEENVAGELNEDFSNARLFYSIIADRRGVAGETYSATVGNITIAAPVIQTVTGDGLGGFTLAEMDQQFSTDTIDASLGDTTLSGSVTLGNFDAGAGDDVWYEAGLVSNETYLGYSRLHNKGVYMIALYTGTEYIVHIQNVPTVQPTDSGNYLGDGDCYLQTESASFDFEIKYHAVTTSSGNVDLRINDGTGWTEWKLYQYAENDVETTLGKSPAEAAALGYNADDDLTDARIVSQIFVCSTTEEIFTAAYDNIEVNVTPYVLAPRVKNVDTGKGYTAIQLAIDAPETLDTHTISVAAGTYIESLVIYKPLTLQGPNAVISPVTGERVEEAIITGVSPLIELEDDADVNPLTIEGFTFQDATDGGGHAGVIRADGLVAGASEGWGNVTILSNRFINNHGPAVGVWATSGLADWTITDNLIDGVTGTDKSGIYLDLDYLDLGAGFSFTGWEVTNNTVKNTQYGGIMVHHALDMLIAGNTIEDVQKTGIQSSGVQGNVIITDNVITRAMLAQVSPIRAGIRLYGTDLADEYGESQLIGPVWVTNNTVTDSYIGFATKSGHDYTAQEVHVNGNSFTGNIEAGLRHNGTGLLDAENNWWGDATGPDPDTEANNPHGANAAGDAVSDNVDFIPWYATETTTDTTEYVSVDHEISSIIAYSDTIQGGIDAALSGDTVNVEAGTYTEAILIDKPLILRGATAGVNKNGYTVPADYAWDDTIESIINHPDPSGGYITIVDIVDVDNVTFEGFVVQELNAVGNLNSSLIRVYAHTQEISDIVVRNNVIGPNTNVTSQDGTHGRMGLYIVNHPYDDQGVISSTFSGNKIFDCKGNGNNVFIWSSYFDYNAPGPASMSGTVIEDNEIYGAHRSGIETAGGFSGLIIRDNKIYGNSGLPSDEPNHLKYGNGILLIRGSSDKLGGPTTAYGPVDLTIENNEIYNNEKNGIYMGPINTGYTITENNIHDNGWDAIRVDLEGTYWNPTFEPVFSDWSCYDGSTNIVANLNNIYSNTEYGVRVVGTPTNGFVLDTTHNYWGHASGPSHELSNGKWVGKGDKVSDNVDYKPWLHKSKEKVVGKKEPAYAQSVDLDNTGDYGWNTFSVPIFLDEEADTWAKLYKLADELAYSLAYRFDSDNQTFVPLTTTDNYTITPGEGFFIKMDDVGSLSILYSTEENLMPPSRPLTPGWNLIGLASLEDMLIEDAFFSLAGEGQVVSPTGNESPGAVLTGDTVYVGESYWVYMLGARTLAGFTTTPVDWVP